VGADHGLGRHEPYLSVVGQFGRPPTGTFGQVALGVCLQTPGDLANQVRPVVRAAGLAVQLGVTLCQVAGGYLVQGGDFGCDIVHHAAPFIQDFRDTAR
jgi:hypothetical protein